MNKIWIKWGSNDIIWGDNPYIWSEVYIIHKVVESFGGGSGLLLHKNRPWESVEKQLKKKLTDDEVERFLRLVVKINDIEVSQTREINDIKKSITAEHITKTISNFVSDVKVIAVDIKKP
jgi:hypothetical protein